MKNSFIAIGAALRDIVGPVDPDHLAFHGLEEGSMHLVDRRTSHTLHQTFASTHSNAGGSAANTAAIAAMLGTEAHFIGKTADDPIGHAFWEEMTRGGVFTHDIVDASGEHGSGVCISMTDPSGQRTMATYLGASTQLTRADVSALPVMQEGRWLFLEAYLLDTPNGLDLVRWILMTYKGPIALTLSDSRCVERHRAFLLQNLRWIDLVIGNEGEMLALDLSTSKTPQHQFRMLKDYVPRAVCTEGPNGVWVMERGIFIHVPAVPTTVVDTTGAGDSLAGSIMWAVTQGKSLAEGARLGVQVAGHIVSVIGARPSLSLSGFLENRRTA